MKMQLVVNGTVGEVDAQNDASLLRVLREQLGLKGAKEACGRGECGACTVLIGGIPVLGCLTIACRVRAEVTTVEGLAEEFSALREAFADTGGFQCGYCTPGQIVRAAALLRSGAIHRAENSEDFVRHQMAGNICRCTGYTPIVDAILKVALADRKAPNPEAPPE